jgi:clan AA aspartic protease (TIGR02281 family)
MRVIRLFADVITAVVLYASIAKAGALEDGEAAYSRHDYKTALQLLQPLAEQGNPVAQLRLGFMYADGEGVVQNYTTSMKWYHLAAEQGNADAENALAFVYVEGHGVQKSMPEAARWFKKAAIHGNVNAQWWLGGLYFNGEGVGKDNDEGIKWTYIAANQGYDMAQISLGYRYAKGEGLPQDYVLGYMWLNLGVAQRHNGTAALMRDDLARRMTPDQIAKAQQLAREWKPKKPVVASTARPQAADALVLDCGASTVLVGEIGRNAVVATTVSRDPVRSSWSVIHHLADSTVVARETQYSMADASQGVGWAGHLNRNHDLHMVGRLTTDEQSDGLVYEEFLYDRGHSDQLILHSRTNCKRATTIVVQSAPPETPSLVEASSAPPTPQASARPSMPRGEGVPIYFERGGSAVYVDVILGSQAAHMLIDTGATKPTVSESLAQELLSRGEAAEGPQARVQLADGSTIIARIIYVHTFKIGDKILRDIEAGVTPDGTDMLLGFPVLNQVGRFTIDTNTNRLIFGAETASPSETPPAAPAPPTATAPAQTLSGRTTVSSGRSAIYDCIAQETRSAVEQKARVAAGSKEGQNDFSIELWLAIARETVSIELGSLTDLQKNASKECSQRLPRDAALVDQKGAAALVLEALDAFSDESSFEENKGAYGEQKASEIRDYKRAGRTYRRCLDANTRSLALASAESAETVAKAAFAACGLQRGLLEAVFNKYGKDGREFAERQDQALVGDIILDIIKARASANTTTRPTILELDPSRE